MGLRRILDQVGLRRRSEYCIAEVDNIEAITVAINDGAQASYRNILKTLRQSIETPVPSDNHYIEAGIIDIIIENAKTSYWNTSYTEYISDPNLAPLRCRRVSSIFLDRMIQETLYRPARHFSDIADSTVEIPTSPTPPSELEKYVWIKVCNDAIATRIDIFDPGKISPSGPVNTILRLYEHILKTDPIRLLILGEEITKKTEELAKTVVQNSTSFSRSDYRFALKIVTKLGLMN